jgi:mevalonate kinase
MGTPGRKSTPSNQTRGLTYINAELKATNERLEQKIKSLQVAVTILLASTAGLGVGLGTCLAGAEISVALASAAAVVFGVITASIAILTFMRRLARSYPARQTVVTVCPNPCPLLAQS